MFGLRRYLCTSTRLCDRQSTPLTVPQSPRLETGPPRCFVILSVWLSVCLSVPAPWCLLTWQWLGFFIWNVSVLARCSCSFTWIFNIDGVDMLCIWPKTFFSLLFFFVQKYFIIKSADIHLFSLEPEICKILKNYK